MAEKAAGDKPPKAATASGAPESPTTARELDFDDDNDAPASSTAPEHVASPPPPAKSPKPGVRFSDDATEIPPPKPPRPMSPKQQAENTLIEAFPDIDAKVVKAVLVASGGNVEPAFNALLSMSDPSFQADDAPPPKPPRPAQQQPRSQVEQDEIYARQLAEHYQTSGQGYGSRSRGEPRLHQPRRETGLKPNELHDDGHSFFDDDLPEIRRNIEQGFRETQSKVNKWITDFKKKLDGEPDEYDKYGNPVERHHDDRHTFRASQSDQVTGVRRSAEARRSSDRERYDSDNRMLGDDFEALELRDDEATSQHRSARPQANPNLFKPTPVSPPQSGPVDEVDALYRNPSPSNPPGSTAAAGKPSKKWQPLTSVAPNPEPDDHDPFSLGDSDEEDAKAKDVKAEDTERLKKAAEGKEGGAPGAEIKPAERSGSAVQRDADAEALLKETK